MTLLDKKTSNSLTNIMIQYSRWYWEMGFPIFAGFLWLWYGQDFGHLGFFVALFPGCMLLSAGFSTLLYPGDQRIPQFIALGGFLGVPLALPVLFLISPVTGITLGLLSIASFISAGALAIHQEPPTAEVPEVQPSVRLAAEVAVDDAVLGTLSFTVPILVGLDCGRIQREIQAAQEAWQIQGWLQRPELYHSAPPALADPRLQIRHSRGLVFEHLSFTSDYEPHPEEPGRDRWLSYLPNRTAHAWLLRHSQPARPWLICIHGYQMGVPYLDFTLFKAAYLHRQLGLNLAFPILPFHGPRQVMRWYGQGFLSGDVLDTLHAEAQTAWDIRRLLTWLRAQGATRIGVYGLSLGGYNTALLAALEDELTCAIAGIPATDLTRLIWRHGFPLQLRHSEQQGLVQEAVSAVLRVVSPLILNARIPWEHRYIFGAVADRLVPADQVRDLWRHWDRPRLLWYPGAHFSFNLHPRVKAFLEEALAESGLLVRAG